MPYRERKEKAPGAAGYTLIIIAANPTHNDIMAWIIEQNFPIFHKGGKKKSYENVAKTR